MSDIRVQEKKWNWASIGSWLAVLVLLGIVIFFTPNIFVGNLQAEIQMGLTVILAVGITMFLLFLMASSFAQIGLAKSEHALALPDGSIRALIALFLIIIFTVVSVYLFRTVANPPLLQVRDVPENLLPLYEGRIEESTRITTTNTFNLLIRAPVTETGEQLGLHLVTILGTLVTAVSAFYFGSSAVAQAQRTTEQVSTSVTNAIPEKGKAGDKNVLVSIIGSGFIEGAKIKLVRNDQPPILATITAVVNTNQINGVFDLTDKQPGIYSVIVVNPSGIQFGKDNSFEIT